MCFWKQNFVNDVKVASWCLYSPSSPFNPHDYNQTWHIEISRTTLDFMPIYTGSCTYPYQIWHVMFEFVEVWMRFESYWEEWFSVKRHEVKFHKKKFLHLCAISFLQKKKKEWDTSPSYQCFQAMSCNDRLNTVVWPTQDTQLQTKCNSIWCH